MAHQSLYRRYRPRRFDEVRGQDHVISALRNAVRNQSEGHAYLFSGPRGTGKTSTARILAKALNCENLQNGEPCCDCTACTEMEAGRSFDLFELDAASNNGVDAVRDLIERAAVGSPGRTKVYILDEVHMLTPGGSNALLKTLEEPPDHVRFVLATTDPQKVLPTIRSRTQHFEFQLLSAQELEAQVRSIVADADLDVGDEAIAWVVQKGRGSSRDTLSALDQVVAAGGVASRAEPVDDLCRALESRSPSQAVTAIADALAQGHDPRVLGASFLESLRDAFLISVGADVPHLVDTDRERLQRWADGLRTPMLTRSMEAVGAALIDMRQAADPRVPLEVALVRLCAADGTSVAALVERIERLEQALAAGEASLSPSLSGPESTVRPAQALGRSPAGDSTDASGSASAPPPVPPPGEPDDGAARDAGDRSGPSPNSGPAMARAELARGRAARSSRTDGFTGQSDLPHRRGERTERTERSERAVPPPVPGTSPSAPRVGSRTRSSTESDRPTTESPRTGPPAEPRAERSRPGSGDSESVPSTSATDGRLSGAMTMGADPGASGAGIAADGSGGAGSSGGAGGVESLTAGLAAVLPSLRAPAKAACQDGRFVSVDADVAVFELGLGVPERHAERFLADIRTALSDHLGHPLQLRFIASGEPVSRPSVERAPDSGATGSGSAAAGAADESLDIDISELEDADDVAESGVERLTRAFPGAVVVDPNEVTT